MPPCCRRINHHRPSTWMLTFVLFGLLVFTNAAADEKSAQPSSPTSSVTPKDENIYIDDEGLEGSGGRGEIHDDLEKEPDYSGSGFGPDDEDSSSSHHSSTTHHQSPSGSGTSGGSGNSGSSSSNSNSNSINNRQDLSNRKDTTRVTEYETGSGDGDTDDDLDHDNDDNEDDDDDHDDSDNDHDNNHVVDYDHDNDDNKDVNIHDDNDEIYTELTDPNEHDEHIPDRSGETVNSKDISKSTNEIDLELDQSRNIPAGGTSSEGGNDVLIMNTKNEDRTASFFAQPGILAAVIGGAVVGLLCAILVVMFIVYRMRKKDEGSYALDEPKRSPAVNSYAKNANNREFYA